MAYMFVGTGLFVICGRTAQKLPLTSFLLETGKERYQLQVIR